MQLLGATQNYMELRNHGMLECLCAGGVLNYSTNVCDFINENVKKKFIAHGIYPLYPCTTPVSVPMSVGQMTQADARRGMRTQDRLIADATKWQQKKPTILE